MRLCRVGREGETYPSVHFQAVFQRDWVRNVWREAVVDVNDDGLGVLGDNTAEDVVGVQVAGHPASAVGVESDWEWTADALGLVDAVFDTFDITLGNVHVFAERWDHREESLNQAFVHALDFVRCAVENGTTS